MKSLPDKKFLKSIKDAILSVFEKYNDKVVFAYLFGTAARGAMSSLSDIDIAVFFTTRNKGILF